jgi:hypothetical protein
MPDRSNDRNVLELALLTHLSQEQPTSAHVSPSNEFAWKDESLAEDGHQSVRVFSGGDAAEQHHLIVILQRGDQSLDVTAQRPEIPLVGATDVHFGEGTQIVPRYARDWRNEPALRGDDERSGMRFRRPREGASVRELPAKVQPAQKTEDLADLHAFRLSQRPR